MSENRNELGHFKAGAPRPANAGRKAGTPNTATFEIKQLARKYGPQAIELCAKFAGFIEGCPPCDNDQTRLAAAREIMDRAYGRAAQLIGSDDGEPIIVNIIRYADKLP